MPMAEAALLPIVPADGPGASAPDKLPAVKSPPKSEVVWREATARDPFPNRMSKQENKIERKSFEAFPSVDMVLREPPELD